MAHPSSQSNYSWVMHCYVDLRKTGLSRTQISEHTGPLNVRLLQLYALTCSVKSCAEAAKKLGAETKSGFEIVND